MSEWEGEGCVERESAIERVRRRGAAPVLEFCLDFGKSE